MKESDDRDETKAAAEPPASNLSTCAEAGRAGGAHAGAVPTRLGRYEILEPVGQGGFATVYRGRDATLQREVALKIPRGGMLESEGILGRFRREAQSAAKLRHPAIVTLHEVGEEAGLTYLVYDFVPGPNLAEVLKKTRPAPDQAAQWVARIADALEYAHQTGIIHRDVKPANILMDRDGQPMLTDFGLAVGNEAGGTLTQQGDILGTPSYMSPEQASGLSHQADGRTDVYSLGVMLYQLLCGALPFGGHRATILHQVIHDEPAPPSRHAGGHGAAIPADLETICLKAMAKEPGRRYASAGELAADLRRYLRREPVQARRIGPLARLARWCRRKPALAATLAAAVVTVTLVAAVGYWSVLEERDRFRGERDRAQANLYKALVSDTQAQLIARDTAWWWKAMDNIRDAAKLDVAARDDRQLRDLAIETLGMPYLALRQQIAWKAHDAAVTAVALSSDEQWLASAGRDRKGEHAVRLWSFPAGKLRAELTGPRGRVTGVAFHPTGRFVAAASEDGTVGLWDLPALEGKEEGGQHPSMYQVPLGGKTVRAIAFAPDGKTLAAGCEGGELFVMPAQPSDLAVAPRPVRLAKLDHPITCLAFAPSSMTLASGDGGRMIRFWDLSGRGQVLAWPTPQTPSSLQYSRDGRRVGWGDIEGFGYGFQDLYGGIRADFQRVHGARVNQILFDGNCVSAGADGALIISTHPGTVRRIELAVARTESRASVNGVAGTRDGRTLAAGYADGHVRLWERFEPPERAFLNSSCQSVAFLGKSRRLVDNQVIFPTPHLGHRDTQEYQPKISALAAHPAGRVFAWSEDGKGISFWDRARNDLMPTARWKGEPKGQGKAEQPPRVRCLASDAQGKLLASGSQEGAVQLWDWHSGALVRTLARDLGPVQTLSWSTDQRYLAAAGERGVFLWDAHDDWKKVTLPDDVKETGVVALGKDLMAVAAGDHSVVIRSLPAGKRLRILKGHTAPISALCFFADGKRLASLGQGDAVRLWNADSGEGQEVSQYQRTVRGVKLALDPQGRYLLSGLPLDLVVWDLQTRKALGSMNPGGWLDCQFLADGSGFVYAATDGSVRLCTVAELEKSVAAARGPGGDKTLVGAISFAAPTTLIPGGNSDMAWGVAASLDGRWFAAACHDGTAHLWDARTLKKVRTLTGHTGTLWHLAFSADSKYLATAGPEIKVWDVSQAVAQTVAGAGKAPQKREPANDQAPPGAKQVKERWNWTGHTKLVRGLAFHPRLPLVASASSDGTVRLWNVETGASLGVLHRFSRDVMQVAFHPDGKHLAAACLDHQVAVWHWPDGGAGLLAAEQTGDSAPRLLAGHQAGVWAVAFDPRGRYLASGSAGGAIILRDAVTFERLATLKGSPGEIRSLSFSGDGELLAGGNYGGPCIVWNLPLLRGSLRDLGLDWQTAAP